MLLQTLIGVIDAQLLKAVLLKEFEPKNIQNVHTHASAKGPWIPDSTLTSPSSRARRALPRIRHLAVKRSIHATHDPLEELGIDELAERVAGRSALRARVWHAHGFTAGSHRPRAQSRPQRLCVEL